MIGDDWKEHPLCFFSRPFSIFLRAGRPIVINQLNEVTARSNFVHFECSYKSRVCNAAAHALADLEYACSEGGEIVTISIPSAVNAIVIADSSANK